MFVWDETDFLSCLETEPDFDEEAYSFSYQVEHNGLRLVLTVFPTVGDISISLFRDGLAEPVLDLSLDGCAGARLVRSAGREWLEIGRNDDDAETYDGCAPLAEGVAVAVRPHIRLRFFSNGI